MENRQVNLTKRVMTAQSWRYCSVVLSANGRAKADYVRLNRKEEKHAEGEYYFGVARWSEASAMRYLKPSRSAAVRQKVNATFA